ncbi:hypothetical protein AN619_30340 [Thermotalea metallivorans]|uniref:Uncharacterized protein n=1 Tax=Thermotalea metallivorans TaxID=520762 RepID=A0A140KZA2_9FIRM|nr:hypothetical protein AN619_30340 [Thermotalea metallivorans]
MEFLGNNRNIQCPTIDYAKRIYDDAKEGFICDKKLFGKEA